MTIKDFNEKVKGLDENLEISMLAHGHCMAVGAVIAGHTDINGNKVAKFVTLLDENSFEFHKDLDYKIQ